MTSTPVVAAVLALAGVTVAAAAPMAAWGFFSDTKCAGTPEVLHMNNVSSCNADSSCSGAQYGNESYYVDMTCNVSLPELTTLATDFFGDFTYLMVQYYHDASCEELYEANAFAGAGSCKLASTSGSQSVIASVFENGSASIAYYSGDACGGQATVSYSLDGANISSGDCFQDISTRWFRFYSNYDATISSNVTDGSSTTSSRSESSDSDDGDDTNGDLSDSAAKSDSGSTASRRDSEAIGLRTGGIVGIAVAVLVLMVLLAACCWYRRRRAKRETTTAHTALSRADSPAAGGHNYMVQLTPFDEQKSPDTDSTAVFSSSTRTSGPQGLRGLWEDEAIATARIPREKVLVWGLVSRGGYGEVYDGLFNHQHVAIKMLLPETRKSVKHLNAFLMEVKLMAALDHPRIVTFIGVAWDALSNLCVVSEFMEGGDLRTLLSKYEKQNHPVGFDRTKVTIAMHAADALTYLHSLAPPVLHRDLKSRNVLLSSRLEAKLTDFGTSRERAEGTTTAGVGSSLWMAPEVMLGEKYGDKADMFSFGVILCELDLHTLPYSQDREGLSDDCKMPESFVLQQVALGELHVEFSPGALESVVALGRACVSADPKERPTAAEALYRLHTILSREM